ncbi:MAG: D-alanyl-D-alanine carboxypeptidase [Clostridiales bacterium]|nr:D-alanyl-D-alanine carboxypeptidase [Clostridiales bacterium]
MSKFFLFAIVFILLFSVAANAVVIDSPSAILIEQSTGRVLFSRNERERRFPANLSKMLTALVVVEHLELDGVVTVGQEIRGMPSGFATNVHFEGETITVRTLLYSLLVRSSNESGRVLALNVARQMQGRRNIPYDEAEHAFSVLMNEKANSLGVRGSHFVNPFGWQSENNFTTAYDLALITRAFMENEILAEIAGTLTFETSSLGEIYHAEPNEREYSWTNTNQLLPGAVHGYPYMTGAKAGFTNSAGHVLAGAATNGELTLVTVVLGGTDAARWQDTRRLMDYGFFNFAFREIAIANELVETVQIENPRLGDDETLGIILSEGHTALLSHTEFTSLTRSITFDPLLYVENENGDSILRAPIADGEAVGSVSYISNGTVVFETSLLAVRAVEERTFDSDMDYYIAAFFSNIFSRRAIPYYFGIFGTAFGVFGIVMAIKENRRVGRAIGWTYEKHRKSRYSRYK